MCVHVCVCVCVCVCERERVRQRRREQTAPYTEGKDAARGRLQRQE